MTPLPSPALSLYNHRFSPSFLLPLFLPVYFSSLNEPKLSFPQIFFAASTAVQQRYRRCCSGIDSTHSPSLDPLVSFPESCLLFFFDHEPGWSISISFPHFCACYSCFFSPPKESSSHFSLRPFEEQVQLSAIKNHPLSCSLDWKRRIIWITIVLFPHPVRLLPSSTQ